ncbi:uncharacterized protein FIBRA_04815 [Fibroporia radiculosa]|uniref:FAD/NAD(P)-binding domain-containing protein n=1 Tax=Fibroporia radiculosa TaxID=599839 RepID=J4H360_9APHY|nr:uncharacterized protein FIBRA_04815 [Fibroporia radiculosa]CCM02709.1 predicted protein [Fibroporia radiculosa]
MSALDAQPAHSPVTGLESNLPTLDKLGATVPPDLDAHEVASECFCAFSQRVSSNDVAGVVRLFAEEGWWRDLLALTWDFRTFHGAAKITRFLENQLPAMKPTAFKLKNASLLRPYPDLVWLMGLFDFETEVGIGSGIFRLVPTSSGIWKGYTMFTNLEDLKGFPEKVGPFAESASNGGLWETEREHARSFAESDPAVLIIGGGQGGLTVAARLKCLGVSTLVIEQQDRIGDNWRDRYEALCLNDPVSMATHVDQTDGKWAVTVRRKDGAQRVFHVDHVVLAIGWHGGVPYIPAFPGRDEFRGQVLHSTQHRSARDHVGKKVVIVGAASSAHDIAADYAEHGVDVTLVQRNATFVMSTTSGIPLVVGLYRDGGVSTDVADRLSNSMPVLLQNEANDRIMAAIADADKDLLHGLRKVGFKCAMGTEGSSIVHLIYLRGGGYYLDVGACQKIIDGEIKLKNDSQIAYFTKTGLKFGNGSEIVADVVILATGFESSESAIKKLVGSNIASKMSPIWNLTPEGELRGVWRWLGVPNLWVVMGSLARCRFHSKHLALQIKAVQEGVYGKRYEA